jgi:hypothetical protein
MATKKETVTEALQEYINRRKQAGVVDLFGQVDFDPKYNYKKRVVAPLPAGGRRARDWSPSTHPATHLDV